MNNPEKIILVTGMNGQVGSALLSSNKIGNFKFIGISKNDWDMERQPKQLMDIVIKINPAIIVNAAAFTNVDSAEENFLSAKMVNCESVKTLAEICKELDIPLIHISTDYVFSGDLNREYKETDSTSPINNYGKSKLAGELAIQNCLKKYIILRTSWIFSKKGRNFVNSIIELGKNRSSLNVVNDQFGGPTSAICVANAIREIIHKISSQKFNDWGIYHFSGKPFVSWYEFSKEIIRIAVNKGVIDKAPVINPIASSELLLRANRPMRVTLSSDKFYAKISQITCSWKEELVKII